MPYIPRAELEALRDALKAFLESYLRLIDSGDCGNWEPRDEKEVKASTAALFALESRLAETGEDDMPVGEVADFKYSQVRLYEANMHPDNRKLGYLPKGTKLYIRPAPRVSPCPDGYACVPKEPTEAHLDVLYSNGMDESDQFLIAVYKASIVAAPKPSEGETP